MPLTYIHEVKKNRFRSQCNDHDHYTYMAYIKVITVQVSYGFAQKLFQNAQMRRQRELRQFKGVPQ